MATRYFALITGIVYLLIGIMGFIPALVQQPATAPGLMVDVGVTSGYGYLMGLFPVNVLHNIVHLTVGLLGIAAYPKFATSRLFAVGLAATYGLLTIMGLFPYSNTTFGLIPIFSNDVWLHAATAAIAAYFGFIATTGPLGKEAEEREYSSSAS